MEIECADSMTTDDLDETVSYSDSGSDSDLTITSDSPYFHENPSDESDENDGNQVWHLKMLYIIYIMVHGK